LDESLNYSVTEEKLGEFGESFGEILANHLVTQLQSDALSLLKTP
jgi:hypothetical protein